MARYMSLKEFGSICPCGDCYRRDVRFVPWSGFQAAADSVTPKPTTAIAVNDQQQSGLLYLRNKLYEAGYKRSVHIGSTGAECGACGIRDATTQAKPCDHMAFCDDCFPVYMEKMRDMEPELMTRCPRFDCLQSGTFFVDATTAMPLDWQAMLVKAKEKAERQKKQQHPVSLVGEDNEKMIRDTIAATMGGNDDDDAMEWDAENESFLLSDSDDDDDDPIPLERESYSDQE